MKTILNPFTGILQKVSNLLSDITVDTDLQMLGNTIFGNNTAQGTLHLHSTSHSNHGQIRFGAGIKNDGWFMRCPRELTTTDATISALDVLGLGDNHAYLIEANILANQSDFSHRAGYHYKGLYYRSGGGGATLQGSVVPIFREQSDPTWGAVQGWGALLVTSGNNVFVRVEGKAATTIDWSSIISYTYLG